MRCTIHLRLTLFIRAAYAARESILPSSCAHVAAVVRCARVEHLPGLRRRCPGLRGVGVDGRGCAPTPAIRANGVRVLDLASGKGVLQLRTLSLGHLGAVLGQLCREVRGLQIRASEFGHLGAADDFDVSWTGSGCCCPAWQTTCICHRLARARTGRHRRW
jgi:hypothetical protein